jgi:hypothetical protein
METTPVSDGEAQNKGGRPSKYRPEYAAQAEKLCALGATNSELADFFEVSVRTIDNWLAEHEEFLRAVKNAKDVADDRVERSLYQRAVGYQTDAVKIFMPAGAAEPVYAEYRENVQPDVTAAIFWLKNRRKDAWRDVSRQEQTGPNGGPIEFAGLLGRLTTGVCPKDDDGDGQ